MNDSFDLRMVCVFLTMLLVGGSAVSAADPLMRVSLADGSVTLGVLCASSKPRRIQIRSEWFEQPMELSLDAILECRFNGTQAEAKDSVDATDGSLSLAFLFGDQSRYVGRLDSWSEDALVVNTDDAGRVVRDPRDVLEVMTRSEMPRQILSLRNSMFRFRCESGWRVNGGGDLVCETPEAAVVGEIELPNRFRIRLRVRCEGEADFELSLGDRSAAGAGQGGRRNDRRGGSLSRMPSERFVTRLEWLGRSVSLIRSNASVSDVSVFDVGDQDGTLAVDLYCDQSAGRFAAYGDGALLGDVSLTDESPVIRRVLTMINCGDPVEVSRLELLDWDGRMPPSRSLPERFTLLRDGAFLNSPADRWEQDRFRVDGKWYPTAELSRMRFGRTVSAQPGCEITLADGSLLRGRIAGRGENDAIEMLDHAGNRYSIDPSRVTRLVGERVRFTPAPAVSQVPALPLKGRDGAAGELLAEGVRMRGSLFGRGGSEGPRFGWRSAVAENGVAIVAKQGVEIRFAMLPGAEGADSNAGEGSLELRSGDVLPGELVGVDVAGVRFQSDICGEVLVPLGEASRLRLSAAGGIDETDLAMLLSLPRRMQDSPPTQLLVSTSGDVLRGRLLSVDDKHCRVEIRRKGRLIPREKVAEIIWLDQTAGEPEACRYVVATLSGGWLGLEEAAMDSEALTGMHSVLGRCRLPIRSIKTFALGAHIPSRQERWEWVPVKEPKTFD